MRRSRDRVGGYRGRRTLTDHLRVIAGVLAVLVVLALAGLFFGQKYIFYTDGGVRLHLPFFSQKKDDLPDVGDVSVVEKPKEATGDGSDTSAAQPAEETGTKYITLPLSALEDGTAEQQLHEAGADGAVLEVKDREGRLAWHSDQALAAYDGVNGPEANNDLLRQWTQKGYPTAALVNCFRDNAVPYHRNSLALRTSGGNWRDENRLRWLDPANEEAQNYLAGLVGELAALGFDEIVLNCAAFPTQGNVDQITNAPEDRAAAVRQFLTQAEQAAAPYGAKVSLCTDRAALTEQTEISGLTLTDLSSGTLGLWLETAEGEEDAILWLTNHKLLDRAVLLTDAFAADCPAGQAVAES